MVFNQVFVSKKPKDSMADEAVRMRIAEHLEKRRPDEAADLCEKVGYRARAIEIRKSVGDHEGVVSLMVKDRSFSEAVTYLSKSGKTLYAVRLALVYNLREQAKSVVISDLSQNSRNPDYTPEMVYMTTMVGWAGYARAIAERGARHFIEVNDYYNAASLKFMVGDLKGMRDTLQAGVEFYNNGSEEGKRIRQLAKELRVNPPLQESHKG
jgi:NAD(P)-dependent dehydrogenase (short-subunit alcohol dehydrogenase family)